MNTRWKVLTDIGLLVTVVIAWVSGLVLLVGFHMGPRCFRQEALGLSRLTWQNLHRVGAALLLACLAVHLASNARSLLTRVRRTLRGQAARRDAREVALYGTWAVLLTAGFGAWLLVPASATLFGQVPLGPHAPGRHPWLDAHHLSAMLSIYLTVDHVARRWRAISLAALRRRLSDQNPAPAARS